MKQAVLLQFVNENMCILGPAYQSFAATRQISALVLLSVASRLLGGNAWR